MPGALLCIALFLAAPLAAEQASDYVRVRAAEDGTPLALEAAVAGFERGDGVRVDLVGAVHVGDPGYYRRLQRRLAGYDRVLFELVGEPESLAERSPGIPSMIGLMQGGMQQALGLAHQLDEIDYTAAHFVHADLSAREFRDSMRARSESLVALLFRAWALGMAGADGAAPGEAEADLLKVLLADDRELALRRALAAELAGQADMLARLAGPDGSTLIEIRNARAVEVLERELAAGHKRLAIFYGAGHLPDLAERLQRDYGMHHATTEWIEAWNLRDRGSDP